METLSRDKKGGQDRILPDRYQITDTERAQFYFFESI